ncbi:uncharacterized protein EMH_0001250 [Eimeria mitis]|uniref:Uncharacterized protein n=1 Tax=Eimeria mitis TaxID=44415 RepID=U6KG15_9EIME|nr:uncharacterized protein EMH_0001250 [Eimeria mitis]CDJ34398.1 hypothetical protein, conserved [Eimeria mitis]
MNRNPPLQQQQTLLKQSDNPEAHTPKVSVQETKSGAPLEQQEEPNRWKLQQGRYEQLPHGEDDDAYLVTLLSAEANGALVSGYSRQLQPQLELARKQPSACDGQDKALVSILGETLHSAAVGEQKAASGAVAVREPRRASFTTVRQDAAETTPSVAEQASVTGLPAATTQLQWIREALILLRRIDDPQHVQLQRRKKTAMTSGACAASPSPTQTAGNTFLPEDTADASTATFCSGSYKCALPPPPRSIRLLYVMWIGVGGGPWGGRSNTWFHHRRYVAAHANAASKMIAGGVELRPFLRAVEALAAAERSLTETCFGAAVARQVLLRKSFGKVMFLRPTLQQLLREDDWSGKCQLCMT